MEWAAHRAGWPHAAHSRFVMCKPHHWHVQEMGDGPLALLIHGAGGATQSWRHLMPLLAKTHRVVAVDLPGQGFTRNGAVQRLGLPAMAQDLLGLIVDQGWRPALLIGHSAGVAIALEIARHLMPTPRVIGINAALKNFSGPAGVLFPIIAKMLYATPFVARFFTASAARPGSITRLLEGTGSKLAPEDTRWYQALISDPGHVDGTLGMMAQWSLERLVQSFPTHPAPSLLIASAGDKTVPARVSEQAAQRLQHGQFRLMPDLGHLAHEEDAQGVLDLMQPFLASD